MGKYLDKSEIDTGLAAASALLGTTEGAKLQALRIPMERDGPPVVETFDSYVSHLRDDPEKGKIAVLQVLHPVKGDADAASRLMQTLLESAGGVEELAPAQTAAAREICETLNLSPSRFGL